jgi:dTDP-4-amino-4,6-dideoxygalactose transaminase
MGGKEQKFVNEAFETNWIAPLGPNVNGFEDDIKKYVGTKAAGVFTSGTASIHLALILLGVKAGDEVLCQSFTFSATANPITYQGATPVFIDSEQDTWNMDPKLLEEAIKDRLNDSGERAEKQNSKLPHESNSATIRQADSSRRTKLPKAIIVVHLYGMPAKINEISAIGSKYGIPIIEDAAEALGSHINGQRCGSFGKLNVLSFNGNKIITTSGGGALLSNDEDLIKKARFLATQARDDAPHYQHSHIGYNYRMSNIIAGVGRGQMEVLDQRVAQKRVVHNHYFDELGRTWLEGEIQNSRFKIFNSSPTGIYFLKEPKGYFSNRWLTTVIINPEETGGVTREDIRLALEEENIEARPLWKPMHLQPVFADVPALTNGVSEWLFEHGLCLPSGSNMSKKGQERVIKVIRDTLASI